MPLALHGGEELRLRGVDPVSCVTVVAGVLFAVCWEGGSLGGVEGLAGGGGAGDA